MDIKVRTSGNSLIITIPKSVATSLDLKNGDHVEAIQVEDGLHIKRKTSRNLKDYFEDFYGKPIEEIQDIELEEYDWGPPVGREIW